ncbi:hypothetical protein M408DRAFT_327750 [Serendipita vermifera MAFF 305830]|uniref:Uncharacterized protein n=1 Tax=Serendipita vermifera MAFF 305830 TaxID=933852 RepID=A0A0C3BH21_SERVB|nr:hypothetical protein M408DRAFT_327750 [Serendipita vermifera MAFF 305830]
MHQDSHESISRDLREKDPGPLRVSSLEDDALLLHSLKDNYGAGDLVQCAPSSGHRLDHPEAMPDSRIVYSTKAYETANPGSSSKIMSHVLLLPEQQFPQLNREISAELCPYGGYGIAGDVKPRNFHPQTVKRPVYECNVGLGESR